MRPTALRAIKDTTVRRWLVAIAVVALGCLVVVLLLQGRTRPVSPAPRPTQAVQAPSDPFAVISRERLLASVGDLVDIQPHSGWRGSASQGEAEALELVAGKLDDLAYLEGQGLELEWQSFRVFLGIELRETRLELRSDDGRQVEVPADGLRGPRDEITQALRFDSDGVLNDAEPDPVAVTGSVVLIRSADDVANLANGGLQGKLAFVDYALVDRITAPRAAQTASDLLAMGPAGLVLVTSFSNERGVSHGSFAGDGGVFSSVRTGTLPPTLFVRLEDLAAAGLEGWADLPRIESARLTWDADVFSPAPSGNLIARIPGSDPSLAVILGAHIDSPNSPGAMDDGSGSAVLLEVAYALEAAQVRPPADLYLAWFGSEELGLYGSSYFASTHQELLDRTVAMLQIDCLARPLDGITADLSLVSWSYERLGDGRLAWPEALGKAAGRHGVGTVSLDLPYAYSDNSVFGSFDVPNADLIYLDEAAMEATGSLHYAAHIHDPYDTVDLAREMGGVLEEMARVALAAALKAPGDAAALRVTPRPDRRALFVASHTEPVHMTATSLTDLAMALSWEGYDVDMIPYGRPVTAADLASADLVVALPVADYPSGEEPSAAYDEGWGQDEIVALQAYAAGGGLLVLTNSAYRLKPGSRMPDANEDWSDANALAEPFGVVYQGGTLAGSEAQVGGDTPLAEGVGSLALVEGNAVPFRLAGAAEGRVVAQSDGAPVAALLDYGRGHVLALADLGILGAGGGGLVNLGFWQSLARYARR